jgi:RND family efflux transporter MFP subunit
MFEKETKSKVKQGIPLYIAGGVVLLGGAFILVSLTGTKNSYIKAEAKQRTEAVTEGPHVSVEKVSHSSADSKLTLEGDAVPYASATLFAKIGGYLSKITVDKGDLVKAGQVLAQIQSPETDQQYLAAMADSKNKEKVAARDRELFAKGLSSTASVDQSDADEQVAKQNLAVLQTQKDYEYIRAPFAGRVTARYVDPGALIQNAVNQETTTQPVVAVAQVDRLRIDVYVDQRYASFVHVGDPVEVSLPERPELKIDARVTRFSGQLDPQTRMQLVEIEVPNPKGEILAWSTVNVTMQVKTAAKLQIPSAALIVRKDKYYVAIVDESNHVTFKQVQIGTNDGKLVEIIDGLNGDETVALNAGNSVADGQHVQATLVAGS